VVICLARDVYCVRVVQLMLLCPQTPSSLALFKSRLVLPFCWYQHAQVVLEKRPLKTAVVVVIVVVVTYNIMVKSQLV